MGMVQMAVFQIFILLLCSSIHDDAISVQAAGLAINTSCQTSCGNVSNIPYPFGIGAGCYVDPWFEVVCNNDSLGSTKPVLKMIGLEVLNNISAERSTVHVNYPTVSNCSTGTGSSRNQNVELEESPFGFSGYENIFIGMGCNNFAAMRSSSYGSVIGCESNCDSSEVVVINGSSCNGTNCCQNTIALGFDAFDITIDPINIDDRNSDGCKSAFLVEEEWFNNSTASINMSSIKSYVPVVLDWYIPYTSFNSLPIPNIMETADDIDGHYIAYTTEYYCNNGTTYIGYIDCYCQSGFEGNPYLREGCLDINECEKMPNDLCLSNGSRSGYCVNTYGSYMCGIDDTKTRLRLLTIGPSIGLGLLVLLVGGWWSYKVVMKRRMIKQKNKIFKQLLRQQLSLCEADVENTKLFRSNDLEKATDRFNVNRILGQGGQGTVYKGMLVDGRIVAVKKSRVIDEGKLEEFINEVVILSQVNHRNVVKLIGCCLETEVPLLVYEYVPNGTLYQYINGQTEEFPLTWDMRLRIAIEVARALFYLHSAASTPIYHRDIKSTNILLDDKYRAKIADFGTSRTIDVNQTHLTTLVHGTLGYLDPEYFQSSQLTEKSDVYSFGVVLAELLTGEKAISSTRTQESKNLATYFIQSMEENKLFDIIDSQVLKEGKKEEIIAAANLVKRCLNLNGKKRPTMKEVEMELEAVQMLQKAPNLQQNCEELEYVRAKMYEPHDVGSTSTMPTSISIDVQPLLSSQSV